MAYNKFIKNDGTIMLDLTDTTVSSATLGKDITAVDKYGNKIIGTLTDSPIPIEVSTEEEMTALLESGEVGGVYKYVGETSTYENGALYLLKEDPLQGTWVWNDTLDFTAHGNVVLTNIPLEFMSNDVNYAKMYIGAGTSSMTRRISYIPSSGGMGTIAYSDSMFRDVAYQTIDISTTFSELSTNYENAELVLAFLQANATKQ